jgi:diguanylate cyclase (GGDEF)-like protein
MSAIRRAIFPLFIPVALILLSSGIVLMWPDLLIGMNGIMELRAIMVLMPFAPYIIFALGFVMGWRYASAGMILGTLVLALTYCGLDFLRSSDLPREVSQSQSLPYALAFFLPLNLAFYSTLTKRRLFTTVGVSAMVFLAVQVFTVIVFCYPESRLSLQFMAQINAISPSIAQKFYGISQWLSTVLSDHSFFNFKSMPTAAVFAWGLAINFVLILFVKFNDIRIGGFLFTIVAAMLGSATNSAEPAVIFYFIAAGLIMVVTTVEFSFAMAYTDELTGLPGRRSLNEAMLNLGKKYVIAMIDVDRFKKFNDTYGHKTGDQVLRMIASRLGKISGGAKTFRYGGEEFTAIFSGKNVEDALAHVEDFRDAVASTPFVIRSTERSSKNKSDRGKKTASPRKQVTVTVSIGLASPGRDMTDPEKVLKAADKNLYKAKKGGRNRTVH